MLLLDNPFKTVNDKLITKSSIRLGVQETDLHLCVCMGGWFGSSIGLCRLFVDVILCSAVSVVYVWGMGVCGWVGLDQISGFFGYL